MAKRLLGFLRPKAAIIKNEQTTAANTALRVGTFLEDLTDSTVQEFDPSASYVSGQWIIFEGTLAQAIQNTTAGQSPATHAGKWSRKVILDKLQIAEGNNLPVTGTALKQALDALELGSVSIPNASETQAGILPIATDDEINEGVRDDAAVSAKKLKNYFFNFFKDFEGLGNTLSEVLARGRTAKGTITLQEGTSQEGGLPGLVLQVKDSQGVQQVAGAFRADDDGSFGLFSASKAIWRYLNETVNVSALYTFFSGLVQARQFAFLDQTVYGSAQTLLIGVDSVSGVGTKTTIAKMSVQALVAQVSAGSLQDVRTYIDQRIAELGGSVAPNTEVWVVAESIHCSGIAQKTIEVNNAPLAVPIAHPLATPGSNIIVAEAYVYSPELNRFVPDSTLQGYISFPDDNHFQIASEGVGYNNNSIKLVLKLASAIGTTIDTTLYRVAKLRNRFDSSVFQYRTLLTGVNLVTDELVVPASIGSLTTESAYTGLSASACELPVAPAQPTSGQVTADYYAAIQALKITRSVSTLIATLQIHTVPSTLQVEFMLFKQNGDFLLKSQTVFIEQNGEYDQQQTLRALPAASYKLYYRPKGTALYKLFSFSLTDITLQVEDNNPGATGAKPVWVVGIPASSSSAGTNLVVLFNIQYTSFPTGQSLDHFELVDAPSYYSLDQSDPNWKIITGVIPANHPTSADQFAVRVFSNTGAFADTGFVNTITAVSGGVSLLGRIERETDTRPLFRLAPAFASNARVRMKLEASGFAGSDWNPFEPYGTGVRADLGNVDWQYRCREYTTLPAGSYVATFRADNGQDNDPNAAIGYASFVWPLSNAGSNLEMVATKPTIPGGGAVISYLLKLDPDSPIVRGNTAKVTLYQHIDGQQDTPVSGAQYTLTGNIPSGVSVNASTGVIATQASMNPATIQVVAHINGVQKGNALSVEVIAAASATIAATDMDYEFIRNSPGVVPSQLRIYLKTNGGSGTLKWAVEGVGPTQEYIIPKGPAGYGDFVTGDYGNGYTLMMETSATSPNSINKFYVKRAGDTFDLLAVTLPQLPLSGNRSRRKFYPEPTINTGTHYVSQSSVTP